jgi:hypothetical protein
MQVCKHACMRGIAAKPTDSTTYDDELLLDELDDDNELLLDELLDELHVTLLKQPSPHTHTYIHTYTRTSRYLENHKTQAPIEKQDVLQTTCKLSARPARMYACVYVCMVCLYACVQQAPLCVCMYVCMYVCMHACA